MFLGENDIVGASIDSDDPDGPHRGATFWIHTCPAHKVAGDKVSRTFKCIGPIVCDSHAEAREAVDCIQRGACNAGVDRRLPVLAIINPHAGRGKGVEVWQGVRDVLDKGCCSVTEHTTAGPGHAADIVAAADCAAYSACVVVGGDGTIHEVLQGMLRHPDWESAVRLPLCPVPAGSGNGLAASCGLWTPATAAHALLRGRPRPLDGATALQPGSGHRRLAMLSVQHGLLTNLDIGTEHLRTLLGGARFTFGALREIAQRNVHEARFAWLDEAAAARVRKRATPDAAVHAQCQPARGPPTPLLDELTASPPPMAGPAPWPEGWSMRHSDRLSYLNVAGPAWAALDAQLNPWGEPADGAWELVTDRQATRMQQLQLLSDVETGKHRHANYLEVQRIAAMAIEPVSPGTWLTLDGEVMPYEPLYLEVHRELLTVYAPP